MLGNTISHYKIIAKLGEGGPVRRFKNNNVEILK
jgi:hypothetical protein